MSFDTNICLGAKIAEGFEGFETPGQSKLATNFHSTATTGEIQQPDGTIRPVEITLSKPELTHTAANIITDAFSSSKEIPPENEEFAARILKQILSKNNSIDPEYAKKMAAACAQLFLLDS